MVRFNEPRQPPEMIGTKTDRLMLATSSKQMQDWLRDPSFFESVIFRNAAEIVFAIHPSIIRQFHPRPNLLSRLKGRRADWTVKAIDVIGLAGKEIRIMPAKLYFDVCAALGITAERMDRVFPSTGFIGIWLALRDFPPEDWNIRICGFGWEGWKRHDWAAERRWIEERIAAGLISIQD